MSTKKEYLVSLGKRLSDKRRDLSLSQEELGRIGGVSRKTQGNYEAGVRCPDAEYLNAISEYIDVNYIVTGNHSEVTWQNTQSPSDFGDDDDFVNEVNQALQENDEPKEKLPTLEYVCSLNEKIYGKKERKNSLVRGKLNKGQNVISDTPINMEILQFSIETIESALKEIGGEMKPDKKANVIRAAYELFIEAENQGEDERSKTKSNVIHLMTAMGGN